MKTFAESTKRTLTAITIVSIVAAVAVAQRAGAPPQTNQSIKGADIKGRAPVSKEVLKLKLPRPKEATLKNGLRVIVLENHRVPTFTMQMVILSGGISDPSDYHGLSTFTAAMLREGTTRRKSIDIAEQMDTLGATITTSSAVSSLTSAITTSGLVENFDQVLDIFADVIRNPSFPQEELDKYKTRQLQQLQFQRALPQFLAAEHFQSALYGLHPAGLSGPPPDSINRAKSADVARFYATYYRPNNAMLVIVGDVTFSQIMPKLQNAFGDWQRQDVPTTVIPAVPAPKAAAVHLINRPGSVQTVFFIGNLAIERKDPDYFPLLVMNQVLGGGPASRLFLNLREDKGYTYGADSNFAGTKYRGVFLTISTVRTDVTDGAMHEFMYEFKRIRNEKVAATELENAKRALVGSFARSLTEPQVRLNNIVQQKLYDLPADYWDTYPEKVMTITADEVQRVAQKYIDIDHLQIVAVGDATKTRAVLAKYGAVREYDAEGKPVATQ
jgi:predicted Zn-dependent peptidase